MSLPPFAPFSYTNIITSPASFCLCNDHICPEKKKSKNESDRPYCAVFTSAALLQSERHLVKRATLRGKGRHGGAHHKAQLCCAGDRAVAQAAQSLWALLLGDLQTPAGRGLGTLLWVSLLGQGLGQMEAEGPVNISHPSILLLWNKNDEIYCCAYWYSALAFRKTYKMFLYLFVVPTCSPTKEYVFLSTP